MSNYATLEKSLRSLLRGQHSSLALTFNEENGINYESVSDYLKRTNTDAEPDWVSGEERQRAIENNSMWELHWYPDTPVGFHSVAASSLGALLENVFKEFGK